MKNPWFKVAVPHELVGKRRDKTCWIGFTEAFEENGENSLIAPLNNSLNFMTFTTRKRLAFDYWNIYF